MIRLISAVLQHNWIIYYYDEYKKYVSMTGGRIMEQGSIYYTANEVMVILGVSRAKAYKVVKKLNEELAAMGYIVLPGKVPKKLLAERLYGMMV